ncbi:hypothetical protein D0864_09275 [Hortaea werneckii]|uniref:Heterokaryon incompatibility domain-containing protein n=1 Tax=Hortaea werneckii TaxID=91943 RepID=A0A3M7EQX1_HORWE|nr:hypothetical protein D0864_09275 [Hortaea werneckii]
MLPIDAHICPYCLDMATEPVAQPATLPHWPSIERLEESSRTCACCHVLLGCAQERASDAAGRFTKFGVDQMRTLPLEMTSLETTCPARAVDPPWHDFPTSTEARVNRIKEWLKVCDEWHPSCRLEGQSRVPRCLIDLLPEGHVTARLVQTQTIPSSHTVYTALSYCWGGARILKTTKATLDRHMRHLPMHEIPSTITDAFAITRRLGLRYIWVDALCIVQDDEDDWNGEVGNMHEIFAGSYLTLLAAEADSAAGGLFTQQPRDFSGRANYDQQTTECAAQAGLDVTGGSALKTNRTGVEL